MVWESEKGGQTCSRSLGAGRPVAGGNKELFSFAKSNGKPSLNLTESTRPTVALLPASLPSHRPGCCQGEGGRSPGPLTVPHCEPWQDPSLFRGLAGVGPFFVESCGRCLHV